MPDMDRAAIPTALGNGLKAETLTHEPLNCTNVQLTFRKPRGQFFCRNNPISGPEGLSVEIAIGVDKSRSRRFFSVRCCYCFGIGLTGRKSNKSSVSGIGDTDNSLSMRWVKSGARSSMNHAAGAGSGWH